MKSTIQEIFESSITLQNQYLRQPLVVETTESLAKSMAEVFQQGKKVLICGNGGSMCDADHFAEEFTGRFDKDRPPLPVISISNGSFLSCTANDYGYEDVFSRYVEAFGDRGDMLIALSTSGNSVNVERAVKSALKKEMETCSLLGKDGGRLLGLCRHQFLVPSFQTARIQEIHMLLLHTLIQLVEQILFPHNYQ